MSYSRDAGPQQFNKNATINSFAIISGCRRKKPHCLFKLGPKPRCEVNSPSYGLRDRRQPEPTPRRQVRR